MSNTKTKTFETGDMPAWLIDVYATPLSMLIGDIFDAKTK